MRKSLFLAFEKLYQKIYQSLVEGAQEQSWLSGEGNFCFGQ